MAGHTKLPWVVGQGFSIRCDKTYRYLGGPDGMGLKLATPWIEGAWDDDDEARANADFIVRAVNSHYQLVEALREAREALHRHYVDWDGEPEDVVPLQEARSKIDAILSSLKGTDNG